MFSFKKPTTSVGSHTPRPVSGRCRTGVLGLAFAVAVTAILAQFPSVVRADDPTAGSVPIPPIVSAPTSVQPETLSGDFSPLYTGAQPQPGTAGPPQVPTTPAT